MSFVHLKVSQRPPFVYKATNSEFDLQESSWSGPTSLTDLLSFTRTPLLSISYTALPVVNWFVHWMFKYMESASYVTSNYDELWGYNAGCGHLSSCFHGTIPSPLPCLCTLTPLLWVYHYLPLPAPDCLADNTNSPFKIQRTSFPCISTFLDLILSSKNVSFLKRYWITL